MSLIKLNAIDSTNDFLKQLVKEENVENFTIILANQQTNGKGQMGAKWLSESGKNLTMSVLVSDLSFDLLSVFDFNIVVATAAANTLLKNGISKVNLKWPNDIMADNKKVGGILIENIIKPNKGFTAVVGLGLNLNQSNFENLPQANSLSNITNKHYDIEEIAIFFVKMLKQQLLLIPDKKEELWEYYNTILFKRNKAVAFEDKSGHRFMGIIKNVTHDGKLVMLLEDESFISFEVKDVKMLF